MKRYRLAQLDDIQEGHFLKGVETVSLGGMSGPEGDTSAFADQPGYRAESFTLEIHASQSFQTVAGIGGAFSELGGKALASLPASKRQELVSMLFGDGAGAGLNFCRVPIGASDFALDAYCCAEPDGLAVGRVTIGRDRKFLLPFVLEAKVCQPGLKLHASPWSPPAWLKTNGQMTGGGELLPSDPVRRALADYLVGWAGAYAEAGAPISRLMAQNETDVASKYPSCVYSPAEFVRLHAEFLGPALRRSGLGIELWGGTFRALEGNPLLECLSDQAFREAVAGVAVQYFKRDQLGDLAALYPRLPVMHTETICHRGENSWPQAVSLFGQFVDYMKGGCDVFTYWNMILGRESTSSWGWRQNALVTVLEDEGRFILNPDYQVLRLIARMVPPGSRRLAAFLNHGEAIAFGRPDGSRVALFVNPKETGVPTRLRCDARVESFDAPPSSLVAVSL